MEKAKALFVGSREAIEKAYSQKTMKLISEKADILPICPPDEIKTSPYTQEADYIFSTWGMPSLSEDEIREHLPVLKAVFYAAGTVQSFARPFLRCGVRIFSAWKANAIPVAEFTVSEILLAGKGFFNCMHRGSSPVWSEHDNFRQHPGNFDMNVGIIGAGMIGTLVIKELKNHDLNVFVYDRFMSDEKAGALGVTKLDSIPELFEKCTVISNHLANNVHTVGIINAQCFEKMAENGVFINTGRGQQVVEEALVKALKEKPSRCALLDVTHPEPPAEGSELYSLGNVILTPHIAGSLGEEIKRMGEFMAEEFINYPDGSDKRCEVTEKMLETLA